MRCEYYLELLSPYLDNELSPEEQMNLETHLRECSKCQQELQLLKIIKSNLSEIEEKPLPKSFHEQLMTNVNKEKRLNTIKRNTIIKYMSSIAAVFIVVIVFINQNVPSEKVAMHERSIMPQAESYGVSDRARVKSSVRSLEDSFVAPASLEEEIEDVDVWHIVCTDIESAEQEIENAISKEGYEVQTLIETNEIQIIFNMPVDEEALKEIILQIDGLIDFKYTNLENSSLILIIAESISE